MSSDRDTNPNHPSRQESTVSVRGCPPCRAIIRFFHQRSTDVATVDDLATGLSDDQQDVTEQQVGIRLHHVTLPRLAEAGFIEYDARSNTARYRGDGRVDEWGDCLAEEAEGAGWSW